MKNLLKAKCGNYSNDITLEVSPVTFLTGPNGSGKSFIGRTSDYIKPKNDLEVINDYAIELQMDFGGSFEFTNSWIKNLGLGDQIEVDLDNNQGTVHIFVVNGDRRKPYFQLGRGFIQLLKILLTIDFYKCDIDYINNTKKVFVENPEIYLYPAIQSKLADIFYDAYKRYNMWFLIETQSVYPILRSQVLVKKMEFTSIEEAEENSPFKTYCVPMDGKPYSLGYRPDGKFKEGFIITGFYDEASNQAFDIIL